jgi:hypothetical protein
MHTVQRSWMRLGKEFGLGVLMLTFTSGICSAASTAAVSGVVRDTRGVAQMGAMVQVLAAGSASVATAFTDMYGRYRIANLIPGKYQVRATAALFVPATRSNLQLSTGMRATVNLTLNMLSDPTAWLPAKRRSADEPTDDWTWTLRSTANRPILRMADDGEIVLLSDDRHEGGPNGRVKKRVSAVGGSGGFGQGGEHSRLAVDRQNQNGTDLMLRSDVAVAQDGRLAATEVGAGYQRKGPLGNGSRLVANYASHPEMTTTGGSGMQMVRMANAQKIDLGDGIDIEAGGSVYAIHMVGNNAVASRPFLKVAVHPGEVWAVEYKLATARDLQGFAGLDSIDAELPVAVMAKGKLAVENGTHQEISFTRKLGGGAITAAAYHDDIDHPAVAGTGVMGPAELSPEGGSSGVVMDTLTDSFRFLGAGYSSNGIRLTVSEPLTSSLWAALEYASGTALSPGDVTAETLPELTANMHTGGGEAVTAALKGQVQQTGTKLRASYRWQPRHLVTPVNSYGTLSDQAFLSFYVRQAVRWGDKLPQGFEATIDVTNLLAEGYRPFLSADGRTLYLAQSPRTIQAGLSFTF